MWHSICKGRRSKKIFYEIKDKIDNYDEEIIDGDLQCIEMYYYSKDLRKNENSNLWRNKK